MENTPSLCQGYRYPGEIISHAVWLYHRFTLSFCNVEEIPASRGVNVPHESIRQWCLHFRQDYAITSGSDLMTSAVTATRLSRSLSSDTSTTLRQDS
ncbi:hypothetical protein Mmc1_2646 [Magnetococcus marinus MC-1]|uniref:Transposase n=1 Tax=Magnetococcus marinus (strain ATCC BAA-1437 / JCM 17883 / MC-1) TaxID=156889 RepID=A0LAZ9_MAGMM|nr:hypothetical protein Mmc1_2646 [Magnetococcus marinus MC-1]